MENMRKKEGFNYTYSAKEQEEIRNIRQKYQPEHIVEDKMERVRRLDESVTKKATIISLVFGIIGALIMGSGMSLTMTNLGERIGFSGNMSMITGITIGVIGIVLVSCAYPVYNYITKKSREKIAPEILRLTDELLK